VEEFLKENGCEEYIGKFKSEGIDKIEDVEDLTEDFLKNELKLTKVGHIRRLIKASENLKTSKERIKCNSTIHLQNIKHHMK
jgi:hypothetical protein